MLFLARPDGEKLIKVIIEKKNIVAAVDLLVDIVSVFRQPFNGRDIQKRKVSKDDKKGESFVFAPKANNWARMTVEVQANNLCLLLLQNFDEFNKNALALLIDAKYKHEWIGDSWYGPGSCSISVQANLKKAFLFPANHVVANMSIANINEDDDQNASF